MLELVAELKNTDYDSLVHVARPIIDRKVSALETNRLLKGILKNVPLDKMLDFIPDSVKDDIFLVVIEHFKEGIKERLQDVANQKGLGVFIKSISAEKITEDKISLRVIISDIDYDTVFFTVLPLLNFSEQENAEKRFLNELVRVFKNNPETAGVIIANISQSIKDEMVAFAVSKYSDVIRATLQDFVIQQGINTTVDKFGVNCGGVKAC